MQWPSLIVVENTTHRRAIVEHHGTRGIGFRRGCVRRPSDHLHSGFRIIFGNPFRRLGGVLFQHRLFDLPQAANLFPHLNLGVAVGLQHGLGHVAEEMVVAVAMWHGGKLRCDPRHERVLLVRQPQPHRLAQRFSPLLGSGDQASNLVRGRRDQSLGEPYPLLGASLTT